MSTSRSTAAHPSGARPRSLPGRVGKLILQILLFALLMQMLLSTAEERGWPFLLVLVVGLGVCVPLIHWPVAGLIALAAGVACSLVW